MQQLLIWSPGDVRLYWLLGELYNAQGKLADADAIFEECVNQRRLNNSELLEHRRIVKEYLQRPSPSSPLLDTRKLVVIGGLAALVIAGLAFLQVREIRRRRHC